MYCAKLQTYIVYDLLDSTHDLLCDGEDKSYIYRSKLMQMNIFDILSHYNFDSSMISFFIDRAIKFKSRSI